MANKMFCPNCGHPIKAGAEFCPNCGESLSQPQSSMNSNVPSRQDLHSSADDDSYQNDYYQEPNRHNGSNKGLIITIIVLVILLVSGGLFFGYKELSANNKPKQVTKERIIEKSSNSNSNSNNSSSSSSVSSSDNNIDRDDAESIIDDAFTNMADSVSSDNSDDFSGDFVNGTSNKSYQDLANWASGQSRNSKIDGVTCTVQSLTMNGNTAHFNVKYDFEQADSNSDHIQVFVWTAKLQQSDDNGVQIVSCQSNNKAVSDYDE